MEWIKNQNISTQYTEKQSSLLAWSCFSCIAATKCERKTTSSECVNMNLCIYIQLATTRKRNNMKKILRVKNTWCTKASNMNCKTHRVSKFMHRITFSDPEENFYIINGYFVHKMSRESACRGIIVSTSFAQCCIVYDFDEYQPKLTVHTNSVF